MYFYVRLPVRVHTCDEGQIRAIVRWENSNDNRILYWNLFVKINTPRTSEFFLWGIFVGFWSFSGPGPQQSRCRVNRGAWSKPLGFCLSNSSSEESGPLSCLIWASVIHRPGNHSWKAAIKWKFWENVHVSGFFLSIINYKCQNPLQTTFAFS